VNKMHYLLAVVEGETEKGLIEAFLRTKVGQSPEKYGAIEVVPIPAGGNQGYTKLVEVAEQKINEYLLNPDNCYCDTDDDVEKWLVFDYDDIDNKRITLEELEDDAKKLGFSCVVSRPNIEFFILALLKGIGFTKKINPENYKQEINREIDSLNKKLSENPNLAGAFQLASEEQISHPASSNIKLITVLLSIIAIISIIVGSISITSIMIATVTERTHEIGVRKAIGATHFNIFLQFIFESILLNISGAVLGFIIGYAALLVTAFLTEFKIYFSPEIPAIALGVAIFTGFISGTIPSLKAAGKNPIDSIKQPNR